MKIVVTGGSGQIGSRTAALLRERGHDVLTLDVRPPADPSLNHRVIDLRAPSAVRHAFDGMDIVLHLGEMPGMGRELADGYTHNVDVGAHVMQIACQVGVKQIVYTSTCQVYGFWGVECGPCAQPVSLPMDEKHPLNPQNPYALSKYANERYAAMVSARYDVPIALFRFPWVISGSMDELVERAIRRGKQFGTPRDGLGTYLHVTDAATSFLCAIERGWNGCEAFHFVADDHLFAGPIRQELLARHPATPLPEDWPADASPVVTTKAKKLLGWQPKVRLREEFLRRLSPLPAVA